MSEEFRGQKERLQERTRDDRVRSLFLGSTIDKTDRILGQDLIHYPTLAVSGTDVKISLHAAATEVGLPYCTSNLLGSSEIHAKPYVIKMQFRQTRYAGATSRSGGPQSRS